MQKIVDLPLAPVSAVGDRETQGNRLYQKIYLILEDDIDYSQISENDITITDAARTMAALPLKEGATGFVPLNFVKRTGGHTSEGTEGDITSEVTNTLSGTLGGRRVVIDNLLECHLGKNFLAVTIDSVTGKKYIHGRPYNPLSFSAFNKRVTGENASCDVTFTQHALQQELEYLGEVTPAAADDDEGDDTHI